MCSDSTDRALYHDTSTFNCAGSPEVVKAKDRAFIKRFLKALKSLEDKDQHSKVTKTTNGKTAASEKPGEVGTHHPRLSDFVATPRADMIRYCFKCNTEIVEWVARIAVGLLYGSDGGPLSGGIAWEQLERSFEAKQAD
jgi:hypothetical protein